MCRYHVGEGGHSMSQIGHLSAGGSPVAAGGAGGNHRGLRQIVGDFAHHPLAMAGLIVLALALLDTLVAPVFINPEGVVIFQQPLQGPSGSHLLGTDYVGRDELARLLYGVHTSMLLVGATLALAAVVAAVVFAVVRLLGRTRGQEWARWAGVVLTPVVGVLLLNGASLVVSLQLPSGIEPRPLQLHLLCCPADVAPHWHGISDCVLPPVPPRLCHARR